jgi:probable F420-dependent oxidoreductase
MSVAPPLRVSSVDFGLAVRNFVGPGEVPDIDAILAYGQRAEELGFESLWAWDHVLLGVQPSFPILEAISTLTALAVRTRRVKLGTGVLVLPLRNPVVAAKMLASLDQISKGRLLLGVAAGWYAREFDAVGVPFKERGRILDRNLDVLTRLWTDERVSLQVDELNLRDAVMAPRPYQHPRPPILIGGYVDAALRRAGRRGDGWLTYFYTPDSFRRAWDKVLAYACQAGREPSGLTATNQLAIYVGGARAAVEEPMRQWLSTEWDTAGWSESTIEHAIRGSVDECVEQLLEHVRAGAHRLVLIPYRYEREQVEVVAREVLPRLAQAT